MGDALEIATVPAGLHVTALFRPGMETRVSDREISRRSRGTGQFVRALARCYLGPPDRERCSKA